MTVVTRVQQRADRPWTEQKALSHVPQAGALNHKGEGVGEGRGEGWGREGVCGQPGNADVWTLQLGLFCIFERDQKQK